VVTNDEKRRFIVGVMNYEKAKLHGASGQSYVVHRQRLEVAEAILMDYTEEERRVDSGPQE
jgi:hypothetical protein